MSQSSVSVMKGAKQMVGFDVVSLSVVLDSLELCEQHNETRCADETAAAENRL